MLRAFRRLTDGLWGRQAARASAPRRVDFERLVAVTRILDEADIVEAFARHTASYVDHHVFLDNGSSDGTVDILRDLAGEGLSITLLQVIAPAFREMEANTLLFDEAAGLFGAGWVLHLDADEFIDDREVEGGLGRALAAFAARHADIPAIDVPMWTYVCRSDDDPSERIVPVRIRCRVPSGPVTKIMLRGDLSGLGLRVGPGNHAALMGDGERCRSGALPGLVYAHYHERSPVQLLVKAVKGWSKVLAAGPALAASGTNFHYREIYEALRTDPKIFLRNDEFLGKRHDRVDVVEDPIRYRGEALRYTPAIDPEMHAVRALMGQLDLLSTRYGRIISESPDAARLAASWDKTMTSLV